MLRRLIVLRHAKSSWTHPTLRDHARPLNSRGRHDAPRIGARLRDLGWVPELVLSSDAARTRETWDLVQHGFATTPGDDNPPGDAIEVQWRSDFYGGGISQVGDALEALSDDLAIAMLVGHNPGWEDVVEWLSGTSVRMKTCTAALLRVQADSWMEAASPNLWELVDVIYPRDLND